MCLMIAEAGYNREMVFDYAEEVASGFRQPIPKTWPPAVQSLIKDCWNQVSHMNSNDANTWYEDTEPSDKTHSGFSSGFCVLIVYLQHVSMMLR